MLSNMAYTASHSMPFLLLTAIFLFVYAIAGMTLLGGKITEPVGPRPKRPPPAIVPSADRPAVTCCHRTR